MGQLGAPPCPRRCALQGRVRFDRLAILGSSASRTTPASMCPPLSMRQPGRSSTSSTAATPLTWADDSNSNPPGGSRPSRSCAVTPTRATAAASYAHLRDIFRADDPLDAQQHLNEAIAWCEHPNARPSSPPWPARCAAGTPRSQPPCAPAPASNARTEAADARINHVKRSARGFRNLHNYGLRVLLAAGRQPCQTQPVTPIRTRRPSLIA